METNLYPFNILSLVWTIVFWTSIQIQIILKCILV